MLKSIRCFVKASHDFMIKPELKSFKLYQRLILTIPEPKIIYFYPNLPKPKNPVYEMNKSTKEDIIERERLKFKRSSSPIIIT